MRIALLSVWSLSDTAIGGTERFVLDLARLLATEHDVTILSLGTVDIADDRIHTQSLSIVPVLNEHTLSAFIDEGGLATLEMQLRAIIVRGAFDVVHANSLLFAGMLPGIPVVHTVHTNAEEFRASFPPHIASLILARVRDDTTATYIVPSAFSRASFASLTGKDASLIAHAFRPRIERGDSAALRATYDIPERDVVLCVPARLEPQQKGQDILLAALRSIASALPSFTVVLGGRDEQYRENARELRASSPELHLVIEGFADAGDMYSLADVVILPSRTESFGYAALESGMLGLLTFVSDIPPFREIATGNPRIIPFTNDASSLARTLVEHRDLLQSRSIAPPPPAWARRYAEATMRDRYLACYQEAVDRAR